MSKLKQLAELERQQREAAGTGQGAKPEATPPKKRRAPQSDFLASLSQGPSRKQMPSGSGGGTVIHADPEKCRPWAFHDRDTELTDPAAIEELTGLIEQHGQKHPALGRYTNGKDDRDGIEIVYGVRRWLATRKLERSLIVEIRSIDDQQALIEMELENRRLDLSPWERGRSYLRWLETGSYGSARELAKAINADHSGVSKSLKIASIPRELLVRLDSLNDLTFRQGLRLQGSWSVLDKAKQKQALEAVAAAPRALSVDDLILLVEDLGAVRKPAKPEPKPVEVRERSDRVVITVRRGKENDALIRRLLETVQQQ